MSLATLVKLSINGGSLEDDVSFRSERRLEDLAEDSSKEVFLALRMEKIDSQRKEGREYLSGLFFIPLKEIAKVQSFIIYVIMRS